MISFDISHTHIWALQLSKGIVFNSSSAFDQSILDFAKEHNCIVNPNSMITFHATEEDLLLLKIKHPNVIRTIHKNDYTLLIESYKK